MRHLVAAMPVWPSILLSILCVVAEDGSLGSDVPDVVDVLTSTLDNECSITNVV